MPVFRLVAGMTALQEEQITSMPGWGRVYGFIIVHVDATAQVLRYLGPVRFSEFSETEMESPRMYTTIRGTQRSLKKYRDQLQEGGIEALVSGLKPNEGSQVAVAIWRHPEAEYQPLKRYFEY
jgi:hypothetical protein